VTRVDTLSFLIANSSSALGGSSSNVERGIDQGRGHLHHDVAGGPTPAWSSSFGEAQDRERRGRGSSAAPKRHALSLH
jgi:hypothetical protein